jgi:alkyl sulfatase BDS1-like metallo-beta-lactamase superfamily hydrolase
MYRAMTITNYFDYLGVRLNGKNAEGKTLVLNWNITDEQPPNYKMNLSNSALTYREGAHPSPDASLKLDRATLDSINMAPDEAFPDKTPEQAWDIVIEWPGVVTGDRAKVHALLGYNPDPNTRLLDTFEPTFNIIEP